MLGTFRASAQFTCHSSSSGNSSGNNLSSYIPDPNQPVKVVKIAFHVMQREAPAAKDNFDENNPVHVQYLNDLFSRVNDLYTQCNVPWCNGDWQSTSYVRDSRIRFELAGIYYHRDNAGYNNQDGNYANPYCYNNYAICKDEVLNVFFCQIPNSTSGYGPTTHVMMFNIFSSYTNNGPGSWGNGNLLGHEFGHVFGLGHSWDEKSTYPDICQSESNGPFFCANSTHPNCINNVMSYTALNDFFSPLQMAQMNRQLLTSEAISKYLKIETDQSQAMSITSNTTWNLARIVHGDVYVDPGITLTIKNHIIMAPGTRIIVQRGARLIVDGGCIRTKGPTETTCNGVVSRIRWDGIDVWGNTSVTTNGSMLGESYPLQINDPGVVILKNGAIIQNAQTGIYPQQRGTSWESQLEHFGGLISTNNASFLNCRKSVDFISAGPINNSSVFTATKFQQTFLASTSPNSNAIKTYEGCSNWQVSNLQFINCDFEALERGLAFGNTTGTKVQNCRFRACKFGADMGQTIPLQGSNDTEFGGTTAGQGNNFTYCEYGIYAQSFGKGIFRSNTFNHCLYGLFLNGASQYDIVENTFTRGDQFPTNQYNPVAAVALLQTNGVAGLLQCNRYLSNNTSILIQDGIFMGGDNRGVTIQNQDFNSCINDIRLSALTEGGFFKGQIDQQGSNTQASFNRFSPYSVNAHKAEIFTPEATLNQTDLFTYYHPNNVSPGSQFMARCPRFGTGFGFCNPQVPSQYNFWNFSPDNNGALPACTFPVLSLTGSGGAGVSERGGESNPEEQLEAYYVQIEALDQRLVPGKSKSLQQQVRTKPKDSATLQALLAASPYLSEETLAAFLETTGSISDAQKQVLLANLPLSPYISKKADETLSASDWTEIQGKQKLVSATMSARDEAAMQRSSLNGLKMALLKRITDSLYTLKQYETVEKFWQRDPERYSREALVGFKIQRSDIRGAAQLLQRYKIEDEEDERFKQVQLVYLDYIGGNGQYKLLPKDSVALFAIANSHSAQAGYAQTLLKLLTGATFSPQIPPIPKYAQEDAKAEERVEAEDNKTGHIWRVFPNPVAENLEIEVNVASDHLLEVCVYDLLGRNRVQLTVNKGINNIPVGHLPDGVYSVVLCDGPKRLSVQQVIKNHK